MASQGVPNRAVRITKTAHPLPSVTVAPLYTRNPGKVKSQTALVVKVRQTEKNQLSLSRKRKSHTGAIPGTVEGFQSSRRTLRGRC